MGTLLNMKKVNIGYSMNNIPIPDGKSYKLQLIQKVEDFIKKIRWKAIFFMKSGICFFFIKLFNLHYYTNKQRAYDIETKNIYIKNYYTCTEPYELFQKS